MQDSFLRAFTHFESFDGRSAFTTWLTRIGINSALMILRKKRSLREAAVPGSTLTEFMGAIPDISPDPEELYEHLERNRILESAITQLSQKTRGAVELHFLQERSVPEVARQLGVSLTVAKARGLFKTGWKVHIADSAGRRYAPSEFDEILRFDR